MLYRFHFNQNGNSCEFFQYGFCASLINFFPKAALQYWSLAGNSLHSKKLHQVFSKYCWNVRCDLCVVALGIPAQRLYTGVGFLVGNERHIWGWVIPCSCPSGFLLRSWPLWSVSSLCCRSRFLHDRPCMVFPHPKGNISSGIFMIVPGGLH